MSGPLTDLTTNLAMFLDEILRGDTDGYVLTTHGIDTLPTWEVGGGGGTPGGANTSLQFNDAGSFGGFGTWDGSLLTIVGLLNIGAADGTIDFSSDDNPQLNAKIPTAKTQLVSNINVGANVEMSGTVSQTPIIPFSVLFTDDGGAWAFDDGAGNIIGSVGSGGTNTIDYATGAYSVSKDSTADHPVRVNYQILELAPIIKLTGTGLTGVGTWDLSAVSLVNPQIPNQECNDTSDVTFLTVTASKFIPTTGGGLFANATLSIITQDGLAGWYVIPTTVPDGDAVVQRYDMYLSGPQIGAGSSLDEFEALYIAEPTAATNNYYTWFDADGVRRSRADSTFDSVSQAIDALYNPQFTKYTAGAVNFERIILGQWNGNISEVGNEAGGTGTMRAMRLLGDTVRLRTNGSFDAVLDADAMSANRTFAFPDASGTIALTSDPPALAASADLTAQSAAIAATTLLAITASGLYQVSWVATVTTAATTSSILGGANGFQLKYTDADDSVVKTSNPSTITSSAGNTTATSISGTFNAYCKTGTNLQYLFDYTSVGVTAMQFNLHIRVVAL